MKLLRIGHIADSHLKESRYGNIRKGEDFFKGLGNAIEASAAEVDVFVHVGDIFDVARPGPRVIGQLIAIDKILKKLKRKMICVTGNHDWNPTPWFKVLFQTVEEYGIHPLDDAAVDFGGFKFVGVKPHNAVSFIDNIPAISVQVKDADIVLYHGFVTGISPVFTGNKVTLDVDQLPRHPNTKAILLGDIHIQGYVTKGGCLIGYPGSTEVISASEAVDKSVPIIEVTKTSATVSKYIPFATRRFLHGKITDEESLTAFVNLIKQHAHEDPVIDFDYKNEVPMVLARIFAVADPSKCLIHPKKMPRDAHDVQIREKEEESNDLTIEDFFKTTLEGEDLTDVLALALDIVAQPTEAVALVNQYVDKEKERITSELRC